MKHLRLFENWSRSETITLTRKNRPGVEVIITVVNGRIENIDNEYGERFPFFEGQPVTVWMKGWACNNGFLWNGEDPCDQRDEKVFGIKAKDIPKGHFLRQVFPSKFRK